jgi:DNA-binding FrmR family transcriptional regulator
MASRIRAERLTSTSLANADDGLHDAPAPGCCFPFMGKSRRYTDLARSQANAKLAGTAEQLALRVSDLAARVASARNTAASLNAAGKKTEALAALRRSKAIEKQLAASQTALESLETQLLMLEDAKLQAEISTALAASTGDFKKTTRGLLKKTEKAVDDAAEVKDLAEDVHSALDGLKQSEFDEDDLLAELEEMQAPKKELPKTVASHGTITFTLPNVPRGEVTVREAEGGVMLAQ